MGELVGKPSIARKLHRIPCNFLFFATFGGKHGLFSMQLAYVRGLSSMQLAYVHGEVVQQGTYMLQKMVF
jgi:hypothetical protein